MIAVDDLFRGDALREGTDHDRHSVLVGAGDEDDVASLEPLIPAVQVGGQVGAGEVADVDRTVRVGQRRRHKDTFEMLVSHGFLSEIRRAWAGKGAAILSE